MNKNTPYPKDIPDWEVAFRSFRKSILAKYERELEQLRVDWEAGRAVGQRIDEHARRLFERSSLDLADLDAIRRAEQEEMRKFIAQVTPQYIKREPQRDARLREEAELALSYIQSGWSQAYLIGADVMGATPESLQAYKGEKGNPTIWLYDVNKKWKGEAHTQGTGPCLGGWQYCPGGTIWYYAWPATGPGKFSVKSVMFYHGFHILYAIPMPFTFCAHAAINATDKLEVYQQVGYPPKYSKFLGQDNGTVFSKEGYSILSQGEVEGAAVLSTDVNITSLSQVYIAVTLSLQVAAWDYVSYAGINFLDGEANYVIQPFVAISPIP